MLILCSEQSTNTGTPVIISIIGVAVSAIISVVLYALTGRKGRKERLTSQFNQTYVKSFTVKEKIKSAHSSQAVNNEFYFELDYILNNENVKNIVLDYLTQMENYFSIVLGIVKLDNSFKKLLSFALYSRWCAFYGFIIKMRRINKNKKMFENYTKVVDKMEKMDKIKANIELSHNLYYVGIRKSDIIISKDGRDNKFCNRGKRFFKGSINMFPSDENLFDVRPNQNVDGKIFLSHIENQMNELIKRKSKKDLNNPPKFMFYNPAMAYRLPSNLKDYVVCLNDNILLNMLEDKITCRTWLLNNGISIVGFQTMSGQEIKSKSFEELGSSAKYIIQSNYGGGGVGTFLFDKKCFEEKKEELNNLRQYIVSPYIDNSISVNTHVFISDKQTVLSPASVQIIEINKNQLCYRGADFIAFKSLNRSWRDKIRDTSIKIANLLRNKGYRGVAGIDFIISKGGRIFCSEINARFQASSILLDMYLSQNKNKGLAKSVYELNLQAFCNSIKSDLCFEDDIGYSCHYYYQDSKPSDYVICKEKIFRENHVYLNDDGFDEKSKTNEDSYLFRAIFKHQICSISPENTLWINDNILIDEAPSDILHLKIALLNQGVRQKNFKNDVKKGVYESVDILLKDAFGNKDVDINCATQINLAEYSPFLLDGQDNTLKFYDKELGKFEIEKVFPETISDLDRKILYKSTDRIRIKTISGCEFKNYDIGCAFCNVPYSEKAFSLDEIKEALIRLKNSGVEFRHFLIGGGTCLRSDIWETIISIAKYLKSGGGFPEKPISLMSILPPSGTDKNSVMSKLKEAGIEEVAFNLEVCDENLAKCLMPGKYKSKQIFYDTMKDAVKIFGINHVRSAIVVGLDKTENIVGEVCNMAKNGIMPCLSALRALPGAKANLTLHPSNDYLLEVYIQCKNALINTDYPIKVLGPPCTRCCNNMLIE